MKPPTPLAGLDHDELVTLLAQQKEPGYRADQILDWFYKRRATSFAGMTNLPAALREKLAAVLRPFSSEVVHTSTDTDGTVKLGVRLYDGHVIESATIPARPRLTGCVSTQVGCPVQCHFCASGVKGLERNLDAAEIVEQVLHLTRALPAEDRLTHLVFMGIGEGLLNFNALMKAIRIFNAPWGLHLGARRMTVSTVGVPDTIGRLAESGVQLNLAVSLHAANDALRRRIIPYTNLLGVDQIIDEVEDYYVVTGREATFEYVLLAGVNDSAQDAAELAKKLKPVHATVNLIPYNPAEGMHFETPTPKTVGAFRSVLERRGIHVTLRRRHGTGVRAACGQLRLDAVKDPDGRP